MPIDKGESGGIDTSASIDSFFQQVVEGACKNQRLDATPEARTYVAALLADFVRPDASALGETLDRSLTLMLDEALQTPPPDRFEKLKAIGDGTLYVSGFFGDHLEALWQARGGVNWADVGVAVGTLGMLLLIPRLTKRVPAPILALTIGALACVVLGHLVDGFHVTTIGSKFHTEVDGEVMRGIPPLPPMPVVPWHLGGSEGSFELSYATIKALLPAAFTT